MTLKEKNSGPPADFFESPLKTGWLTKLGGTGLTANWRRRYVVLDHHYMFYYKTDKDRAPAGIVCLPEYDIVARADAKECKKPNAFVITSSSNIAPSSQSDHKRAYYMYTDTDEECASWITAVETQMIAIVDPKQKDYFTETYNRAHSYDKNCYQDYHFDDLATIVEDVPKLEHVTANRPKKPHTRAPSRGHKDYVTFDEDDVTTFSPVSDMDVTKKIEKRNFKKVAPPNIKPMKPPGDTSVLQERPIITKPKPTVKPSFWKNHSAGSISTPPAKKQHAPGISADTLPIDETKFPEDTDLSPVSSDTPPKPTETVEYAPKPTPRRKAPSIPVTKEEISYIVLPSPPPEYAPEAIEEDPSHPEEHHPHSEEHHPHPEEEHLHPEEYPDLDRNSHSSNSNRSSVVSIPEIGNNEDHDYSKLKSINRDSLSSTDSSNNSESVYQIPNNDPIYQIPTNKPVNSNTNENEYNKVPLHKLHSVGHSISPTPKQSLDGTSYSDLVTGYFCSSPHPSTPPISPMPQHHQQLSRNHIRSLSVPREYIVKKSDNYGEGIIQRSSSTNSDSSRPESSPNIQIDQEASERILKQIKELEEQLLSLTKSSLSRQSLSPNYNSSNSLSQVMHTDAQRLIDNMRSVVFEAISFHKQSADELQLAKTEKRIAEEERNNLRKIMATLHQQTEPSNTY